DDWDVHRRRQRFEPPADLKTVRVRHVHVQQDQVREDGPRLREPVGAAVSRVQLDRLARQPLLDQLVDVFRIVDDENALRHDEMTSSGAMSFATSLCGYPSMLRS